MKLTEKQSRVLLDLAAGKYKKSKSNSEALGDLISENLINPRTHLLTDVGMNKLAEYEY